MILPHKFDPETHTYSVEGRRVLSTSDVIFLNGMSDFSQVPLAALQHAAWRGTQLHLAIQFFEEDGEAPDMPAEVEPYFNGYLKFRTEYDFEPIGQMEKEIVYEHGPTGQAIGCTIDLRGLVRGVPYIVDAKSSYPQCGKALKQKLLSWRMQTQSYKQASVEDEEWGEGMGSLWSPYEAKRGIVHCNKDGTFKFYDFAYEMDEPRWDACVEVATMKLANGYELDKKR